VRVRVAAGIALVVAGTALVAWAGNAYARGWLAQDRARSEWEQQLARAEVAKGRAIALGRAERVDAEGAPVARLRIARIALDDIVLEGVTPAALNGGPGHLPGSSLPGEQGNAVISAHRDRHFRRLGELAIGDTISTQTLADSIMWRVVSRRVVNREAPAIHREAGRVLTLTTCWPIGYLGGAPDRLILRAVPIESHSATRPVTGANHLAIATNANESPR
jgi:sortase A